MEYHQQLLQQAEELCSKPGANQAGLRRAVSTAYYALFHLLVSETVANWRFVDSRDKLARTFEHRAMAAASVRLRDSKQFPFTGEDPTLVDQLKLVAATFIQLQEQRHIADYDNSKTWTATQVAEEVLAVGDAFDAWQAVRNEKIAQDYLVSLLIRSRG